MVPRHKDYSSLPGEEDQINYSVNKAFPKSPSNKLLLLLLAVSSLGNLFWPVIWAVQLYRDLSRTCDPEQSQFAGLTYDVPVPFRDLSMFVHHNINISDATWDNWVVEPGIVALPHDFVNRKMLPQARNSPLDKDKGVYILSSYHSLHCLQHLRKSFISIVSGTPFLGNMSHEFDHNLHCFDFLRQDIICHADDTPRYTGLSKGEEPGMMQSRMCRSWDKMEAWARSNTACFRDMNQDVEGFPVLNQTNICPNGYIYSADGSPSIPWLTGVGVHSIS